MYQPWDWPNKIMTVQWNWKSSWTEPGEGEQGITDLEQRWGRSSRYGGHNRCCHNSRLNQIQGTHCFGKISSETTHSAHQYFLYQSERQVWACSCHLPYPKGLPFCKNWCHMQRSREYLWALSFVSDNGHHRGKKLIYTRYPFSLSQSHRRAVSIIC